MADFDIFPALTRPGASASGLSVHNVRLVDAHRAVDGRDTLVIEHAGRRQELVGAGQWHETFSRRDVGKFGYVVPAHERYAGACYFRDYLDQSLRRAPEFDCGERMASTDGRAHEVIGWRCDDRPEGFRAPVGLIPGEGGLYMHDETVAVTLRVPPEFVRECHRVSRSPEELLRSFVGDLSGIQNFVARPRADGYGSNGSDERDLAAAWLERAHGMDAIDLDAVEALEEEAQAKQFLRDDFAALLDDFEGYGGKSDDLMAAVQALVDKQAEAQREEDA